MSYWPAAFWIEGISLGLHWIDYAVLLIYLAGITVFGISFRRRGAGLREYFLGGRQIPWWAIALSIVAAETSVLTIISTPGLGFAGNLTFLQLVLGYLTARVVVSTVLLQHYFRGELFTAYELMRRRFGARLQRVSAAIFLVGRALAEGVRLFAVAIVVSVVLAGLPALGVHVHISVGVVIAGLAVLTLIYTFEGGMRAVIWTDFIQICIYMAGAVLSLWLILRAIPGGWTAVVASAAAHGDKFRVFDFHFSWYQPYTFWSGVIGGTFLTASTHGTDQLMVQRLLSARNLRDSRKALFGSWLIVFAQFAIFLVIGVMLFVYYRRHALPPAGAFGRYDRIYPEFIARHFPAGVAGLVMAAIIAATMSNLSAALNSLSSSTVFDFYRQYMARGRSEAHYMRVSRLATLFWAVVLGVIAYLSRFTNSVLVLGLSIVSIPFSGLLGIFLLGTLTRKASETGAIIGMIAGVSIAFVLYRMRIPFTWFIVAGTVTTFVIGWLASWVWPQPRRENSEAAAA